MQLGYRAKKSIVAPGSATEAGGGAESSGTNGGGADQASADESINEQVLVDQDGIKITATEYVTDSIWEMELSFWLKIIRPRTIQ